MTEIEHRMTNSFSICYHLFQSDQMWIFLFDMFQNTETLLIIGAMITNESWRQEFIALRRERLRQAQALGSLPLLVLGREQSEMARRQKELDELTALSTAGKLIIAKDSGHEIHLYRPDLVVQAIREVVTNARSKKSG